ncbi:MAG: hypothetical protein ACYCOR_20050 [Acidobacteriaceae bacterium]
MEATAPTLILTGFDAISPSRGGERLPDFVERMRRAEIRKACQPAAGATAPMLGGAGHASTLNNYNFIITIVA